MSNLATLYYGLHRHEDGAKERQIVDSLTAKQQPQGPVSNRYFGGYCVTVSCFPEYCTTLSAWSAGFISTSRFSTYKDYEWWRRRESN